MFESSCLASAIVIDVCSHLYEVDSCHRDHISLLCGLDSPCDKPFPITCGQVREEVCLPVVIQTIPHEPWQEKGFPVPRALRSTALKMCQERMENRVLEYAFSTYSNDGS